MSMKQRILGCLKGAQPVPALFTLLAEAEPTQQTPIKETILRLFEAEHDWTNVQTHLKQWGGLVGWANDFLQRMYVRVGEPSFGRILTEPEQIDAELARVANLYWANVSERKPRAEAERLQRGPKPTPADVDFVFAAAKQDSGRSIEHELRKHSFAATGSAELYQPTKVHMTSKSKMAVKDSVNFLDSLPQIPKPPEQKPEKQKKQAKQSKPALQPPTLQVIKKPISKIAPINKPHTNDLSFSEESIGQKQTPPSHAQTSFTFQTPHLQPITEQYEPPNHVFDFQSIKKPIKRMSQTSNQLFAPETAALIKRGGAKGTTSSSIIDVLMKKTEVSIVEIAAEKIRRELTQRN